MLVEGERELRADPVLSSSFHSLSGSGCGPEGSLLCSSGIRCERQTRIRSSFTSSKGGKSKETESVRNPFFLSSSPPPPSFLPFLPLSSSYLAGQSPTLPSQPYSNPIQILPNRPKSHLRPPRSPRRPFRISPFRPLLFSLSSKGSLPVQTRQRSLQRPHGRRYPRSRKDYNLHQTRRSLREERTQDVSRLCGYVQGGSV